MQRNIKRTMTVVMALVCVLLLVSPVIFAKTIIRVDDEGLKGFNIRADIYEGGNQGAKGQRHGRVQAMVREVTLEMYSYKFMIDMKKATPNTPYGIWLWVDLPEEVEIAIYGNGEGLWPGIEWIAWWEFGIDDFPGDNKIETTVGELLNALGFTDEKIERDTCLTIRTDSRGNYKHIKEDVISEQDAIEWAVDLGWPHLREILVSLLPPGSEIPEEIDFVDLGIVGLKITGGYHVVSGGVRFEGRPPEGNSEDIYSTEEIIIARTWNDFIWGDVPS